MSVAVPYILNLKTVRYSETLKLTKQTTRCHKPEDNNNSRMPVVYGIQSVVTLATPAPYTPTFSRYAQVPTSLYHPKHGGSCFFRNVGKFVQTPRLRIPEHRSNHSARCEAVGLVQRAKADESVPQSFLATQTGDVDQWRCRVVGICCLLLVLEYSTADFSTRAAWHDDEMTGGGRWGEMRHVLFLKVQSTSESEKETEEGTDRIM